MAELSGARVLVIGIDPLKLDPARWGVTAEHNAEVRRRIDASERELIAAGYAARFCLLGLDEDMAETLAPALTSQAWDCVVVGGGIRKEASLVGLFERVINAVHRHAPDASIGFNDRPDDVPETVERVLAER